MGSFGWIYWDPSSEIGRIPFLGLPITWYGFLFAVGFWFGFHIFVSMYTRFLKESGEEKAREKAMFFAEKLVLYVVLATVIGARIAYILFYQNPMEYLMNPLSILKTWEGGLASHGGITAILLTLWVFHRKSRDVVKGFSFLDLLDHVAVPTMLVASMIRIGNFFNQEILGTPSSMPWAIVFGHPKDGSLVVARHPVQLYESLFYFALFVTLVAFWYYKGKVFSKGRLAGIAIGGSFLFRFFIEFVKTEQSTWFDYTNTYLLMGQVLSIPMIVVGFSLLLRKGSLKRGEGK